ncbi:MAG: YqjF family protein [Trueperaceae bacterium]
MYRTHPTPSTKPVMFQRWHDLLFMHWPVPIASLRSAIPVSLELETFEGQAWLAVVPFRMSHIHPRGLFTVPGLSAFPELNLRTYVIKDGKPGVWFFSLDAANPTAVFLARTLFKLPYFNARMQYDEKNKTIHYSSSRTHRNAPACEFRGIYTPVQNANIPKPGTLEYFLTARYCLYTADAAGTIYRGEIDHEPWPLQAAEANVVVNTVAQTLGITLTDQPLLHFSKRVDVKVWGLKRLPK